MGFDIDLFKLDRKLLNENFENAVNRLKEPKYNLRIDNSETKELSTNLDKAKKRQKENIKFYEDDNKRYKVLKKYGEVIAKIENLLGLIPSSLSNLSVDELVEKLEELSKTKKRNEFQMIFIFFQNLFTDTIKNLLTIEKNFQEGILSSQGALQQVKEIKHNVGLQAENCPKNLIQTKDDVDYLITLYENGFKSQLNEKSLNKSANLIETDLKDLHKDMLDKLKDNSEEMLNRIEGLTNGLSNFEPQVDLTELAKDLKDTEDIIQLQVWNPDDLDKYVHKLEDTTDSLTSQQIEKNEQQEKLSKEIENLKETVVFENTYSYKKFAVETFKDAEERAIEAKEITIQTDKLVSENGAPTTIGGQVANAIITQMDADIDFCTKVETEPESDKYVLDLSQTKNALDQAEILKSKVLTLEEKQEMILKLEKEKDEK